MRGGETFVFWNITHRWLLEWSYLVMINFHSLLTPLFNLMFLSPSGRPHGPTLMHEGVPFRAIHHIFEKKRQRERVEEGYRCGRWASDCTDSCEGREAFQSRKWLDLPGGRQTQPDISPHCFEHPGSLRAPTEGQWSDGRPAGGREESKHGWCCFLLSE